MKATTKNVGKTLAVFLYTPQEWKPQEILRGVTIKTVSTGPGYFAYKKMPPLGSLLWYNGSIIKRLANIVDY